MRQVWIWAISGSMVVVMIAALVYSAPAPENGLDNGTATPILFSGQIDPSPSVASAATLTTLATATATVLANPPTPTNAPATVAADPPTATKPAVATSSNSMHAASAESPNNGFVPEEVVVKLVPGSDLAAIAADFRLNPTPLDQFGSRAIYRMHILDGVSPVDRAAALQSDLRIEFAEPNYTVRPPEWSSRYSWARFDAPGEGAAQWAQNTMRLAEAHQVSTGAGVTVAVLDTGVDATHPDLAGRIVPGYDFVDLDNDPSEAGGYADATPAYGHGTHVAGLIALAAPDASIMPVRVLDPQGNGNIWVLAEAILYAADPDDDPTTPEGADIINLSLGTLRRTELLDEIITEVACYDDDDDDDEVEPPPPVAPPPPTATPVPPPPPVSDDDDVDDDIDDDSDDDDSGSSHNVITLLATNTGAGNTTAAMSYSNLYTVHRVDDDDDDCDDGAGRGVTVIASAGNSGTDTPEYPAAEDVSGLLSVASSTIDDQLAGTSSFGLWVDVAAPGEDIVSTMPQGQYATWSGTSMSSALAAGQAALIRAAYPDMTSADVVARIISTADAIPGNVPFRINAAAAVTAPR